ncbi:MAG TPA: hypothetical protein PLR25_16450, partial [Planctomycetaceae bacterium]|nr:hypothetical protein [Planctomycetaceae bacterium]
DDIRESMTSAMSDTRTSFRTEPPLGFMPVERGFEDGDTFQFTNPCSTGVKPVGGKASEFTAHVSTQTCGRLAQGQSGRAQASPAPATQPRPVGTNVRDS